MGFNFEGADVSNTFIPHTVFLDDPYSKGGKKLVSAKQAAAVVDREYLLQSVCDSGIIKNPSGPVGSRYVDYLTIVFGYLFAAMFNDWDQIQMSLRYMFPDHEKRVRIESFLKFSGVIDVTTKGYKNVDDAQVTVWKINNKIWKYVSERALEKIQQLYTVDERANTVISTKETDDKGNMVIKRQTVDGVNDAPIRAMAKKYPYMIAFRTIYNDAECKTNGRIYHPIQGLTKENREAKLSMLHGCNVVTVDIKSSLPRLCLMVMGKRIGWNEDIYEQLDGCKDISRDVKKRATTIFLNATDYKLFTVKTKCELDWDDAKRVEIAINKLTKGIARKAKRLGLRLMNIEGRMQTMMLRWALENDVPWFPMHDGGHCPDWAAEAAERHMQACIEQIISEMTFAERAEILEITEDELMQVMAGLPPKADAPKKQTKQKSAKNDSQMDSGDADFIDSFLKSRKAA